MTDPITQTPCADADADLSDRAHNKCPGFIIDVEQDFSFVAPPKCGCPCHQAPRCGNVYIADHGYGVFDCHLHVGHGGYHEYPLRGGSVLWRNGLPERS